MGGVAAGGLGLEREHRDMKEGEDHELQGLST